MNVKFLIYNKKYQYNIIGKLFCLFFERKFILDSYEIKLNIIIFYIFF